MYVYGGGLGTLEENEIFNNALSGVAIGNGGRAVLRRNRITGNQCEGIQVFQGGEGVFEENDLRGNARGRGQSPRPASGT